MAASESVLEASASNTSSPNSSVSCSVTLSHAVDHELDVYYKNGRTTSPLTTSTEEYVICDQGNQVSSNDPIREPLHMLPWHACLNIASSILSMLDLSLTI